ncbi:hypothetical protein OG455_41390 [Kitasatospora sp. NBC_01287]|uniref:hypothetical protein n=1 Tax=Kitasatospora sp. NBC_01287 TaxID=2903573 RepID=UPI0022524E15|nr:hypothetical protein [Kitasatospora sp. NBC_01287]MCX4750938.1 hypothetical protein [Kitasatospora sp. NBC_01287]MCX4751811.1 hypothetical protein [Kitasatospora sp. NBC_01287]MCX4751897.1 hypothetical protein [Kitasatospora sp. NBC_01287]
MSVDRARTMGLTAREIAEALTDTPLDEPVDYPHPSAPRFGWGAPDIGAWATRDIYGRPAAWNAFGENLKEQQ